jgi:hypothetical protein
MPNLANSRNVLILNEKSYGTPSHHNYTRIRGSVGSVMIPSGLKRNASQFQTQHMKNLGSR